MTPNLSWIASSLLALLLLSSDVSAEHHKPLRRSRSHLPGRRVGGQGHVKSIVGRKNHWGVHASVGVNLNPSTTSSVVAASATSIASATSVAPTVQPSSTSSAVVSASAAATATTTSSSSATAGPTDRAVYVHHMLGNTYPYTEDMWYDDIKLAKESGFDGFAANMGTDSWQVTQLASAYAAAEKYGSSFKIFISFDMSVFPCASASDAQAILSLATTYASHPNQATYDGKPIVSTFAGSTCTFGDSDWTAGFTDQVKTPFKTSTGLDMFFLPSVFVDPATLTGNDVLDGHLNWNGAWPTGNENITFVDDEAYVSALDDKVYMASVSPVFFTHYGPNSWNKNWIYLSDGFLFAKRWEILVEKRDQVQLVEALTWNDYGESSYLGPIQGAQPNSQSWVDGLNHTTLLEVNQYFAEAYRSGSYPDIEQDVIHLSARPHSNSAVASADDCGRPTGGQNGPADGYQWTEDKFFALVFASGAGSVTLTSGSLSSTHDVQAGINYLDASLQSGSGMSATMTRDGTVTASVSPASYTFQGSQVKTYNWNYYFFSSSSS
ncbi:Glycoside hydrolase, family 71 [Phaffia rhodozyma]|uniref:Glycoside hydrolase, family 71 n=1 Tax=Phaffia rhodozyma TaxID=264483 RepID=A0A0F7SN19_PHARH|nr:Glycoside hydrolase, family 71 [Phaffia rhodozyma]